MKKKVILLLFGTCIHLIVAQLFISPGVLAGKGESWKEPLTGIEFVWLPPACFQLGTPPSEAGREADEGPEHESCVDSFWLGKTEVTVGQFKVFVNKTGYITDAEREGFSWVYNGEWVKKAGYTWQKAGFPQNDNHPVVNVSLNDARAMAKWLTEQSGLAFRLPTEAEWEYACRAGTSTIRFWGNDPKEACMYANVADLDARSKFPAWIVHDCSDGYIFTSPAGDYQPNAFDLYDMLGNVWEWCEEVYNPRAYRYSGRNNSLHTDGDMSRVIRGASWYSRPEYDRCGNRDYVYSPSRRGTDLGFRLVRIP